MVEPDGLRSESEDHTGRSRHGRPSTKRLLGIDRSGPNPQATRAGAPLRPLTLPNLIGCLRLALIPAFLAVALASEDGRDVTASILFAVAGWGDYVDGFAARLTGQFSRLGALLDPVIDRLLVISGMVVCWHFVLLPRWALALAIARELVMLVLSRYSLHRGIDIKISWPGRVGVVPTMGAPFFAILSVHWLALILLYIGLALSLTATTLYMRRGLQALRKLSSSD
jgi:cardiolipin synthase